MMPRRWSLAPAPTQVDMAAIKFVRDPRASEWKVGVMSGHPRIAHIMS